MADSIEKIIVPNGTDESFAARWGSVVCDYKLNGVTVDFQDLMVAVAEHRATAVEGEVGPQTVRMRQRNERMEKLGTALSELTKMQSAFKSDDGGTTTRDSMSDATWNILSEYAGALGISADAKDQKKSVDAFAEKVKNVIDSLNNASQKDMTRMEGLVDRRDEAFTTATNLMKSVSETRDNVIRNY